MMRRFIQTLVMAAVVALPALHAQDPKPAAPLRLAIAGLVHGHVSGFLKGATGRKDVQIVGVFDPDPALRRKYAQQYGLPEDIFFADLAAMLDRAKPEAVASFTSTYDHPTVVEAAATRQLTVMMEKPLAVNMEHARRIQRAADRGGIQVFVNYETTWYANHTELWSVIKDRREAGDIRKIVALDGHQGPKKINVQPEFFEWLTDPVKNGAGALFDFGCYGANLMTWLMDNARPIAVMALVQHFQPDVYPRVDDEATVLVEYPKTQGIIQASWNWPVNRKDLEVYAERGLAIATTGGGGLTVTIAGQPPRAMPADSRPEDERNSISHLIAVARGARKPNALSSLANNMIVTEILEAARESARTHARVALARQ